MKKSYWIILAVVLIAGSSLITQSDWYKNESSRVAQEKQAKEAKEAKENQGKMIPQNQGSNGVVWQVEKYLKETLHDPGSYEGVSWGKVKTVDSVTFSVSHEYRAKNQLGAMVKESKVFTLDRFGVVLGPGD